MVKGNSSGSEVDTFPYSVYISVMATLLLLGLLGTAIPLFFSIRRRRARAKLRAAQDLELQRREQWLQGGMQSISEHGTQPARSVQAQGLPHPDQFSMHNVPV